MSADVVVSIARATMSLVFVLWCVALLAVSLWGVIVAWRRRG